MPDTSRRRIREAVVQLLYAVGPADELPEAPNPAVIALLLEPAREKYTRARARAVLHLQQGRQAVGEGLTTILQALAHIEIRGEEEELGESLKTWASEEEAVREYLEGLRHELNGNGNATRLQQSMDGARGANRASLAAATRVADSKPHLPAFEQLHQDARPLHEALTHLATRLSLVLGEDLATLPELKSVARAEQEICRSKSSIESYYRKLHPHLDAIDQRIADAIDNYSPERLDRVDRAILRLGGYEILFAEDVPVAVAINEAIELARSFGTTESPGFINGVLDRVAQNA